MSRYNLYEVLLAKQTLLVPVKKAAILLYLNATMPFLRRLVENAAEYLLESPGR